MFKKSSKFHLSRPTSYRGDVRLVNTNQKQMHGFSPVCELMRVNFILGLNVIILRFKPIITHCHTQRQRKTKSFQPWIKLNHNCDISGADLGKVLTVLLTTERRRRKNLGGSGGMAPRKIFSILMA